MLARLFVPLLFVTPALAQASFQGLGVNTRATGISSDGQYVTGLLGSQNPVIFRWDSVNGAQAINSVPLDGGFPECATNGQHGCGTYFNQGLNRDEAVRWDAGGTFQFLGGLAGQSGTQFSTAYAMDDSGNAIVGLGWSLQGQGHAFKWTLAGGMTDLGASPGGYSSRANGISGDGNVVVGWDIGSPRKPAYWDSTGLHGMGNNIIAGEAWAASYDGSVITGFYGNQLFRWTQSGGIVQLGWLAGSVPDDQCIGEDISADGSTIVGMNGNPFLGTPWRAFFWRPENGIVDLRDYLVAQGATQAAGWQLQSAMAISADGTKVTGYGINPSGAIESFVATLPPASTLTAFCDPGQAGVLPCPCANPPSGAHRGCNNSASTGGASLVGSGLASLNNDSLVLTTSNQRPSGTSIVLQGTTQSSGLPFGQGVRCVGGALKRLYVKTASGGSITAPVFPDPSVSARSAALGDAIGAGTSRHYMVYYRDPIVLGGCSATATWNATNAGSVQWTP